MIKRETGEPFQTMMTDAPGPLNQLETHFRIHAQRHEFLIKPS